jgi:hypothetical protein
MHKWLHSTKAPSLQVYEAFPSAELLGLSKQLNELIFALSSDKGSKNLNAPSHTVTTAMRPPH